MCDVETECGMQRQSVRCRQRERECVCGVETECAM